MTTQRITELAFRVKGFPPFPAVANRVMALTADPESSIQDLMDVVNADQSLATMTLKMANSPFFGLSKSVVSLKQALTVLGFKEIQTLVLSRAVF